MAHNVRLYPDVVYVNGSPIPAAYFQNLDTAQFKSLSGDFGGSFAPVSAIQIGGAGVWFCGLTQFSSGAAVQHLAGSGARIVHSNNDWFGLQGGHAGATRNVITPLGRGLDISFYSSALGTVPRMAYDGANDGLKAFQSVGGRMVCPLRVHHNATLVQVNFFFVVTNASHTGLPLPTSIPMFRVFKVDASGNVTNLFSNVVPSAGWTGNGLQQVTPKPANGTAWYAGGATQQSVYFVDAGTIIDTSKYTYYCEIIDEQGVNSLTGNLYLCAQANHQLIPDLRPQ